MAVQDTEQHLRHSIAAGGSRSTQRIRACRKIPGEIQLGLVVEFLFVQLLHSHESHVQRIFPLKLDQVHRHRADGAVVGVALLVPGYRAQRGHAAHIDDREQRVFGAEVLRESETAGGVETERLVVRGFMPNLDSRGDVHGEGWAEYLRKPRPQAPAVVGPLIARTCRIGPPGRGGARLFLLFVGVADITVECAVEVMVDPDTEFIGTCRRGPGDGVVVAGSRTGWAGIVTQQLCPHRIRGVARKIGQNVARDGVANEPGLCGREPGSIGVGGRLSIRLTRGNRVAAVWVVNLAQRDGTAQAVHSRRGAQNLGEVTGAEVGVGHSVLNNGRRGYREVFVQPKDECLIPLPVDVGKVERTAGRYARLVAAKGTDICIVDGALAGAGKVVQGVGVVIGIKLVSRAVEISRPRFRDHVHDVACTPAILGGK